MKIKADIGTRSLVGISGSAPFIWGNYFWFKESPYRCINMWAENLEALVKNGILADEMVEVDTIQIGDSAWAIVTDTRIPKEYLLTYPYFVGYSCIPKQILRHLVEIYGWDVEECQRYLDPKTYYEERGGSYDEKTGIIRCPVVSTVHNLEKEWKVETIVAAPATYADMEDFFVEIVRTIKPNMLKDKNEQ